MLLQYWIRGCLLVQQEVKVSCIELGICSVHGSQFGCLSRNVAEAIAFRLFECELEATVVHRDNESGIRISENLVFHDQSKHIDIRYHFLRDCVQRGTIQLEYIQRNE